MVYTTAGWLRSTTQFQICTGITTISWSIGILASNWRWWDILYSSIQVNKISTHHWAMAGSSLTPKNTKLWVSNSLKQPPFQSTKTMSHIWSPIVTCISTERLSLKRQCFEGIATGIMDHMMMWYPHPAVVKRMWIECYVYTHTHKYT